MGKVKDFYAGERKLSDKDHQVIQSAVEAYLRSTQFGSAYRRAMQLLTISGCRRLTDEVTSAVEQVTVGTSHEFVKGMVAGSISEDYLPRVSINMLGSYTKSALDSVMI